MLYYLDGIIIVYIIDVMIMYMYITRATLTMVLLWLLARISAVVRFSLSCIRDETLENENFSFDVSLHLVIDLWSHYGYYKSI